MPITENEADTGWRHTLAGLKGVEDRPRNRDLSSPWRSGARALRPLEPLALDEIVLNGQHSSGIVHVLGHEAATLPEAKAAERGEKDARLYARGFVQGYDPLKLSHGKDTTLPRTLGELLHRRERIGEPVPLAKILHRVTGRAQYAIDRLGFHAEAERLRTRLSIKSASRSRNRFPFKCGARCLFRIQRYKDRSLRERRPGGRSLAR